MKRARAVIILRESLPQETQAKIKTAIQEDPQAWWAPYHFGWGMSIRNLLREKGLDEEELEVANLDDVYVGLVEEAVFG